MASKSKVDSGHVVGLDRFRGVDECFGPINGSKQQLCRYRHRPQCSTIHQEEAERGKRAICLMGASLLETCNGDGFGYWLVRKYIISEDGEVDVGVAQFIKWSMRVVAVTCIILSTKDTPLAMAAVGSCLGLYYMITKMKWHYHESLRAESYSGKQNLWGKSKQTTPNHGKPEFLSRSKKNTPSRSGQMNSFRWSNSNSPTTKGISSGSGRQGDVYSTFHKTPNRRKFSKKEWEEFTEESTRESIAELASTPEFTDWVINNADRIKLLPEDNSDGSGSGSDSTDEYHNNVQQSGTGQGFFNWQMRK